MKKLALLAFSAWLLLLSQAVPAQWNWATVVPSYPLVGPSFTGQLKGPVTANCSAPSYSFTGDLNTGLTATAADTAVICTGGTARITATNSGVTIPNPIFTGTGGSGYPIILAQSWARVVAPAADTNENILATLTIPANAMGANGTLRVTMHFTMNNNANVKTMRIRLSGIGGSIVATRNMASSDAWWFQIGLSNRGATNSQYTVGTTTTGAGSVAQIVGTTSAIDTTAATTAVITVQKATGTDTVNLEGYTAELIKP